MNGNGMTFLPGTKSGSKGVVKQHQALASGYDLPKPERRVKVFQSESETGEARSPGMTNRRK
jgi:hypothetical protein